MAKRPLLSWKLNDYVENGIEPPKELKGNPEKTEAELMDEKEIIEWFQDSLKTLRVLKDDDNELFTELKNNFILDIQYLNKIGIIEENILDEILEDEIMN